MFKKIKEFFSREDLWTKCECLITLTVSKKMKHYDDMLHVVFHYAEIIRKHEETIKKQEETIKKQSEQIDKLMKIHEIEFGIYDLYDELWKLEHGKYSVLRDMDSNQWRTDEVKKKLDRLQKKKYDIDYGKHHRQNSNSDGV